MFKVLMSFLIVPTILSFIVFGQTIPAKAGKNKTTPVLQIETLEQKITRFANAHRLNSRLFHSLIYAESAFKTNARSHKGAGCLTQLMPATARRFGLKVNDRVDERFTDVDKCLNAGANYLAILLNMFDGDVRLALAGYNAGESAVLKFNRRIPPYRETVLYVEKICALYYGQTGHGVAMAYNQPLADLWVASFYRKGQPKKTATYRSPTPVSVPTAETPTTGENVVPKKSTVTRIQLPPASSPVRLRTESLSFYK